VVFEVIFHKEGGMHVLPFIAIFPQVRVCQWAPAAVGVKDRGCEIARN